MPFRNLYRAIVLFVLSVFVSCSYLPEDYDSSGFLNLKEEAADYLLLYSGEKIPTNAFLFVPGGFVDPHAYLEWADRLVADVEDVAVIIVRYPSNLAITNMEKVMKLKDSFEGVDHWVVGGHSLGGVVASTLVFDHLLDFDGMVLMGSWSREATDLSDWDGCVVSLYATEDMLASVQEINDNKAYLPPENEIDTDILFDGFSMCTYYYEIEGGNHSGFGSYGFQKGDGEALISLEAQQVIIIDVLSAYFQGLW